MKNSNDRKDYVVQWISKLSKREDRCVQGIRNHVNSGLKISDTVKGKLSLSARIIQAGGVDIIFRHIFYVEAGEKLVKASQCYLSTTSDRTVGMQFIWIEKIAFHSDRSLKLTTPEGELTRVPYKVLILLSRIERVSSKNKERPKHKYVHIAIVGHFELWFMGFLSHHKSFNYIQRAISESQ